MVAERGTQQRRASAEDSVVARRRGTDGEVGRAGVRRVQRELDRTSTSCLVCSRVVVHVIVRLAFRISQ